MTMPQMNFGAQVIITMITILSLKIEEVFEVFNLLIVLSRIFKNECVKC